VRPRVVHLSADFPDPITPHKTRAIERLVELTDDRFDHWVVSLNREPPGIASWFGGKLGIAEQPLRRGIAVTYRALGRGLRHRENLERLGDWLAARIARLEGLRPALLVAHKLTVEGIAVARAARALGIPYALSIQGNTDEKIVRLRPDLAPKFREVLDGARMVFPFAPWALQAVSRHLGVSPVPARILPCATELDRVIAPGTGGNGAVTVFHLPHWRNKNFAALVDACRAVPSTGKPLSLAVIGGGQGREAERCRAMGARAPTVTFEGELASEAVPARLNAASVMVLPSRRESFGLAFIEALFAGCPVIYPAGQAIDGYFDGAPFAIPVDARSSAAVAAAIRHALHNEAALKEALAAWQGSAEAERFKRPAIARQFGDGLAEAIGSGG